MSGHRRDFLKAAAGLATISAAAMTATSASAQQAAPAQSAPSATSNAHLPLIKIVATGGTIANFAKGRLPVEDVLVQIPQIKDYARIEIVDVVRVGSSSITQQNWIDVAATVNRVLQTEPEVAGVVVTHGSNTSEETAYFLSLTVNHTKPVVVTAAQRQNYAIGSEGTHNLLSAIRVAADAAAASKGVMLVVNEKIHPAREVTKRIPSRVESWDSGDAGALGVVDNDKVVFYNQPVHKHTAQSEVRLPAKITQAKQLPRVDIIYAHVGADGIFAEAAVKAGAKALVVACFPTGGVTPAQDETLKRLKDKGVFVILANRGGLGRLATNASPYITADNLSPQKARILAMLAIANNPSEDFVRRVMASH